MDIIELLKNPFVWGTAMFILGMILGEKRGAWCKIGVKLMEAIEIFDNEIKDIYPDVTQKKIDLIKEKITKSLNTSEKKVVDKKLEQMGYKS